jgi:hypothetical protein
MAGPLGKGRFGVTLEGAVQRASSLDLRIRNQVDDLLLKRPYEVVSDIRAYLIRRADEMSVGNNPWKLLKFREDVGGFWLIALGPSIDKGDTADHFHFDSGARLSFVIVLREHDNSARLITFRYQYQLPDGASPSFLRFDLNQATHENPLTEPLCHLHPGLEDVRLPLSLHAPIEILDRIFFVVDKNIAPGAP